MNLNDTQIKNLVDACIKLVNKEGVFAFSFSALCKEAGISNGTFFRNIKSRDDLLVLTFINIVETQINLINNLSSSELTLREQIVCQVSYPVFYCGLHDSHFGINFLGANWGLIKNAQPDLISSMQGIFRELSYQNKQTINKIQSTCTQSFDHATLQKIFKHLLILSRGGSVIASNRFLAHSALPIEEFIELVDFVLTPIPWPDEQQHIRIAHIKTFMRTASDKGYRSVI